MATAQINQKEWQHCKFYYAEPKAKTMSNKKLSRWMIVKIFRVHQSISFRIYFGRTAMTIVSVTRPVTMVSLDLHPSESEVSQLHQSVASSGDHKLYWKINVYWGYFINSLPIRRFSPYLPLSVKYHLLSSLSVIRKSGVHSFSDCHETNKNAPLNHVSILMVFRYEKLIELCVLYRCVSLRQRNK